MVFTKLQEWWGHKHDLEPWREFNPEWLSIYYKALVTKCRSCGKEVAKVERFTHGDLYNLIGDMSKLREEVSKLRATKDREIWWAEQYFKREKNG